MNESLLMMPFVCGKWRSLMLKLCLGVAAIFVQSHGHGTRLYSALTAGFLLPVVSGPWLAVFWRHKTCSLTLNSGPGS